MRVRVTDIFLRGFYLPEINATIGLLSISSFYIDIEARLISKGHPVLKKLLEEIEQTLKQKEKDQK